MRLQRVENGHSIGRKALLLLVRVMTRSRPPDVVRTLSTGPASSATG